MPPTTSADFDRAYRLPLTLWGDLRIPAEIKALARHEAPRTSLELGCGLGRFSRYLAQQGMRATAVDFSPVAIARAQTRVAQSPSDIRLSPEVVKETFAPGFALRQFQASRRRFARSHWYWLVRSSK